MTARRIVIGTHDGHDVGFDLDLLLATRLLIQAGSGGGKSWALRRLMEQAFGRVQIICVDPEGEFSSLREKFDFVLAGKGGEATVDPRAAAMLAERLLALKASAICDIYELKAAQRHAFVRTFLDALIDAPKELWHPVLVIVDEAHVYCPEKGQGESEAHEAMTNLATRGRKRGFAAIFATQHLGKLSKNASGELMNRLIGPTFEDVHSKRAAEILGILPTDQRGFMHELRVAEPGSFWALGRAISLERIQIKIGRITTSHPEVGKGKLQQHQPPTPEKIKQLLPQLADLPKEAEEKARTVAELRAEILQLRRQVTAAQKQPTAADPRQLEREVAGALKRQAADFDRQAAAGTAVLRKLRTAMEGIGKLAAAALENAPQAFTGPRPENLPPIPSPLPPAASPRPLARPNWLKKPAGGFPDAVLGIVADGLARQIDRKIVGDCPSRLSPGEKAVLIAAAQYPDGVQREQLSVLTGYKRSSRDAYILRLSQRGYITIAGTALRPTEEGIAALGSDYEPLPAGEELQEYWRRRLSEGERKVLEILIERYPEAVPREEIDERTGYKRSSRDAYLQRLSSRRLVEIVNRGAVRASEDLF